MGLTRNTSAGKVVREPGFEPGTYRLGGGCSIQLSYKRTESLREGRILTQQNESRQRTGTWPAEYC